MNRNEGVLVYIPSIPQPDSSVQMTSGHKIQVGAYFRKKWSSEKSEIEKRLGQWTNKKKLPVFDSTHINKKKESPDLV